MSKKDFIITEEKINDAREELSYVNTWINNIDTKISIILAFMVVWLGYILIDSHAVTIDEFTGISQTGLQNITLIQFTKGMLIISLYFCSIISILYFFYGLRAKINETEFCNKGLKKISCIFFGSINKMDFKDFKNKMYNQNYKNKIDDIYSQIYINSKICTKKCQFYNIGTYFAAISILLFVICRFFNII